MVMLLADEPNIREVIAFPFNQQAQDLMMNAPAEVSVKQLRELHIEVKLPKRQEKAAGWACYLHTTKDVPDGIVSINHKVGHIEHLFVTEKARGRGIGMKMLDFARRKLSEHEHPVLSVLNTNTRAIALYTRMGWKLTSGTELEFTPEQYPAVVKKCALVWMRYEGSAQK